MSKQTGPSRIVSPNPHVLTIVVNEQTGELQAHANHALPHVQLVMFCLKAAEGFIEDSFRQARGIVTPGGNPPETPPGTPGETPGGNQHAT